ncbi:ABC transporter permease [Saprospiraceae bacterium]|nr:ABC transporter permease [Saprospiraceae bacterium]
MSTIKSLKSEFLKLKYPPILWLIGFILLSTLAIVFSAYIIDINKTVLLGVNPWIKLNASIRAIFSTFIGIPFVVLFISAALNIEHQNHGFKQLYTLPQRRSILIIYKLAALIFSFIAVIILMILGNILIGYILSWLYPETEFLYYDLPIISFLKNYWYVLISYLGIIGIQFFLSVRFRGFLVPASIGILAFVFGIILSSLDNALSKYFPYCYPSISRNNGVFSNDKLNIDQDALINQIELSSIIIFITFLCLSIYSEKTKNV